MERYVESMRSHIDSIFAEICKTEPTERLIANSMSSELTTVDEIDVDDTNNETLVHVVLYESPDRFHVVKARDEKVLGRFNRRLDRLYSDDTVSLPEDKIKEGQPCVARLKDGKPFYRAQIATVLTDEVHVYFVDHGDGRFVPFDCLKPLWTGLDLVPFAKECTIFALDRRELWNRVVMKFDDILASFDYEVPAIFLSSGILADNSGAEVKKRMRVDIPGKVHVSKDDLSKRNQVTLLHPESGANLADPYLDRGDELMRKFNKKMTAKKERLKAEKLVNDQAGNQAIFENGVRCDTDLMDEIFASCIPYQKQSPGWISPFSEFFKFIGGYFCFGLMDKRLSGFLLIASLSIAVLAFVFSKL